MPLKLRGTVTLSPVPTRLALSGAGLCLLATPPVWAHLVSTELGPVYDSVYHFAMSPESLVPILGLAVFAGQRGPDHARWALFAVTGGWLLSALAGIALPPGTAASLWSAGACMVLGGLLASDSRLPLAATGVLAAAIGILGSGTNSSPSEPLPSVLGLSTAVFVVTALTASLIVPLRVVWLRIAVRVAGSWLAALGLLLAGWAIRSTIAYAPAV